VWRGGVWLLAFPDAKQFPRCGMVRAAATRCSEPAE
jgi:hypothetical protein